MNYAGSKIAEYRGNQVKDSKAVKPKSNENGRAVLQVQKQKISCPFCKEAHFPVKCKKDLSVEQKKLCLEKAGFCAKCLRYGHADDKCSSQIRCRKCQANHHGLLCTIGNSTCGLAVVGDSREIMLPTGHLTLLGPAESQRVRFLLDSGSERSYITEEYAERLKLKIVGSEKFLLHRFGETSPKLKRYEVAEFKTKVKEGQTLKFNALIVPQISGRAPDALSDDLRKLLTEPADHPGGPRQLGLLFCFADMVKIVKGGFNQVARGVAVLDTVFEEIPVGGDSPGGNHRTSLLVNLEKFWDLEHAGILPGELSKSIEIPQNFVQEFLKKITFDGVMYSSILNLNLEKVEFLSNNYHSAKRQLQNLIKFFESKVELGNLYSEQMEVFFENNFAELLPPNQVPKYFMPHFPVVNESKESYEVRPVFNAFSKMKGQLSLNEVIVDVPNLLPTPVEVLSKFRTHTFALSGDITKAYMTV